MHDVNLYINFALNAVYGKLAEADAIMRAGGDVIRSVARFIAKRHPIAPTPLYRGMLLDPAKPFVLDPRLTFLSWSEDRDVAYWFAARDSMISAPLVAHNPALRGYIAELAAPRDVLFHYSWAELFDGLAPLALQHPFMGPEGQRQIAWSLRTQREVITGPIAIDPQAVDVDATTLARLEHKLAPSWLRDDGERGRLGA